MHPQALVQKLVLGIIEWTNSFEHSHWYHAFFLDLVGEEASNLQDPTGRQWQHHAS